MKSSNSATNLQDYSARLEAVLNTVIDGIITIDESGIIQGLNPSAVRIFGYAPDEVTGQNVKMLMPEPYHSEHDGYLKNYMTSGKGKVICIGREVQAKRKDGSIFPMELGINEMSISGKRMFVGTIRDISDRKQAEQALKDSQAKMQAILDNTVDGLITIDEKGCIETFNKACESIFGYKAADVAGENVKILMPDPYHAEHDFYLKNYHDTGNRKIIGSGREVKGKRKNGDIFPIDLSVSEVNVKGRKIYSGIVRDISDRKKIEQDLLESQKRYDIAVKGMGVGLWDWDIKMDTIYWSPTFLDIAGITDPAFVPTLEKFKTMVHPEDVERVMNILEGHLKRQNAFDVEYRLKRGDGAYIWIRACGLAVWDEHGHATRMVGSVNDVSDRKKAEEELLRSNDELERFAYIASHDLQEPLRMVSNFTSLLESEYKEVFDEQAKQYMNFIVDASRRMQDLVGDLLEYSRIGHEETGFTNVDSTSHTRLALENLQENIESAGANIIVGDLPVIQTNPVRFVRLMQNLVGNGIKYRGKNKKPEITIKATDRGDEWLFSVADNGIGIKQEYLEQIFIIFKRLHNKKDYKGTGIGLAVCKKIVEGFDGKIWANSEPGKGSTFFFTVPKKEIAKKAA